MNNPLSPIESKSSVPGSGVAVSGLPGELGTDGDPGLEEPPPEGYPVMPPGPEDGPFPPVDPVPLE